MRNAKFWWILFVISAGFFALIWNFLDPARGLQAQIPDMLINVYPLSLLVAVISFVVAVVMTLKKRLGYTMYKGQRISMVSWKTEVPRKYRRQEAILRASVNEKDADSYFAYAKWVLQEYWGIAVNNKISKTSFDQETINIACEYFIKAYEMGQQAAIDIVVTEWNDPIRNEYRRYPMISNYVRSRPDSEKAKWKSKIAANYEDMLENHADAMEAFFKGYKQEQSRHAAVIYLASRCEYLKAASDAYTKRDDWEDFIYTSANPKADLEYAIFLYALHGLPFNDCEYDHKTGKIRSPFHETLDYLDEDEDNDEDNIEYIKKWQDFVDGLNKFVQMGYEDIDIVIKYEVTAADINCDMDSFSDVSLLLDKADNYEDAREFKGIFEQSKELNKELPSEREERLRRFSEHYDRQKEEDAIDAKINAAIASNFTMDGFGNKQLTNLESQYGISGVGRPSGGGSSSSSAGRSSSSSSADNANSALFMAGGAEGDRVKGADSNVVGRHEGGVYKDASGTPRGRLVGDMYQDEHGNTIGWRAGDVILDANRNQIGRIEGGVIKNAQSDTIGRIE